jgi:hypothetical protein
MCFFKLGVMGFSFHSPAVLLVGIAGPEETKNQRGNVLRLIQIRLAMREFEKIYPARQAQSRRKREPPISNSINAVSFPSAHMMP